jgi:hypothetical protein
MPSRPACSAAGLSWTADGRPAVIVRLPYLPSHEYRSLDAACRAVTDTVSPGHSAGTTSHSKVPSSTDSKQRSTPRRHREINNKLFPAKSKHGGDVKPVMTTATASAAIVPTVATGKPSVPNAAVHEGTVDAARTLCNGPSKDNKASNASSVVKATKRKASDVLVTNGPDSKKLCISSVTTSNSSSSRTDQPHSWWWITRLVRR